MLFDGFTTFDTPVSSTVKIHGVQAGQGPALLLLHGFPQTHHIWHLVAPALTSKYTVIVPDLRGYGGSSKPRAPADSHALYAKSAMAADMAALMKMHGHARYFVCGHDRGGRVAHKLMVDFPDRVIKCIVLDIAPTLAMFESTDQLFATAYYHWFLLAQPAPAPEIIMAKAPETFLDRMAEMMTGERAGYNDEAFEAYVAQMKDSEAAHGMCEDYRAGAAEDLAEQRADLKAGRKIKCPLRVLWGKRGLIEKKYDAVAEWQKVSDDGLVDSKGSRGLNGGHYIPEELPEDTINNILEFLKE